MFQALTGSLAALWLFGTASFGTEPSCLSLLRDVAATQSRREAYLDRFFSGTQGLRALEAIRLGKIWQGELSYGSFYPKFLLTDPDALQLIRDHGEEVFHTPDRAGTPRFAGILAFLEYWEKAHRTALGIDKRSERFWRYRHHLARQLLLRMALLHQTDHGLVRGEPAADISLAEDARFYLNNQAEVTRLFPGGLAEFNRHLKRMARRAGGALRRPIPKRRGSASASRTRAFLESLLNEEARLKARQGAYFVPLVEIGREDLETYFSGNLRELNRRLEALWVSLGGRASVGLPYQGEAQESRSSQRSEYLCHAVKRIEEFSDKDLPLAALAQVDLRGDGLSVSLPEGERVTDIFGGMASFVSSLNSKLSTERRIHLGPGARGSYRRELLLQVSCYLLREGLTVEQLRGVDIFVPWGFSSASDLDSALGTRLNQGF